MARSIYKVPFVHKSLFKECLLHKKEKYSKFDIKKNKSKNLYDFNKAPRFLTF